jgi:molybdopterin/thiamine biosynthesis adenylyltransferase
LTRRASTSHNYPVVNRQLRNRYSRQTMFPGIGDEGQEKLGKSRAVVIGCGALGCNIASLLVRAGIGRLRIVDRDFPEYHNLQRQVLFDEDDVANGIPKAVAAERRLKKINSSVEIEGIVADANSGNIERLISGADVILDGLDNFETRFLLNDAALKHRIPWVYGGAIASNGMTMNIIPGETACLRCIAPILPSRATTPTCETAGIVGTVPAVIGALQATEAMKILIGSAEISRELVIVDVWKRSFACIEVKQRADCPACQGRYESLVQTPGIKTNSLCGQTRAVQVLDSAVTSVALAKLAARLKKRGDVSYNEFVLRFRTGDYEISVFPDGRAIVKNTLDESLAKELYARYVADLSQKA